eukprot:524530_1
MCGRHNHISYRSTKILLLVKFTFPLTMAPLLLMAFHLYISLIIHLSLLVHRDNQSKQHHQRKSKSNFLIQKLQIYISSMIKLNRTLNNIHNVIEVEKIYSYHYLLLTAFIYNLMNTTLYMAYLLLILCSIRYTTTLYSNYCTVKVVWYTMVAQKHIILTDIDEQNSSNIQYKVYITIKMVLAKGEREGF